VITLGREYGSADWRGPCSGGCAIGVLAVATLPQRAFVAVVGMTVLVCAGLSVIRWRPRPTVPALLLAGVVSGSGGTASSIGGPPVALVYQDATGPRVHSTR